MNTDRNSPLRDVLLDEIIEEVCALEDGALDQFLTELGLNPDDLIKSHARAIQGAISSQGRSRFEIARTAVRRKNPQQYLRIASFDFSKKQEILENIRRRAEQTKEMTLAARNRKIEALEDLDSFLEACLRLGVIDEDGNLKN